MNNSSSTSSDPPSLPVLGYWSCCTFEAPPPPPPADVTVEKIEFEPSLPFEAKVNCAAAPAQPATGNA